MWKVEFLLGPDKCLWIRLGLTPSLLLLRGFLFLFIDGPRGMCAAWSWKILPVETIPGEESLKLRDIPQERLSYSKHTHTMQTQINTSTRFSFHLDHCLSIDPGAASFLLYYFYIYLYWFIYRCVWRAASLSSSRFEHMCPFPSVPLGSL